MPSNRSQTFFLWRGELKERSCKAFEYLLSWLASREGGFFSQTILESMHLQPLKEMNSQPLMISINIQKSLGRSSRQEDLGLSDVGDPSGSRQQDSEVSKRREQASDIGQQDQTFDENEISVFSLATKRTKMKANKTTTQSIGEKEYFPCPQCKKPLTTASALTRHVKIGKCTPSATFNQGIVVKCPLCPKICQTSGGLVRHTKSAHADNVSLVSKTLPARPKAKVAAGKASGSSAGSAGASAGLAGASAGSAGQDPRVTAVRRLTRASSEVSQ